MANNTVARLSSDNRAKLRNQTKQYKEIAEYIDDGWGLELDKAKLVKNIHKNLMGVDELGKLRPYEDLAFFLLVARQYSLNPLKKEIYATYQRVQKNKQWVEQITPITSIHGLRKLARRSKNPRYAYTGDAELSIDENGQISSAKVPVYGFFGDSATPVKLGAYTAYFEEFAKTKTDKDGNTYYTGKWKTAPKMMLTKCAEANAIRQSFDISGIYIEEEIVDGDDKILQLGEGAEEDEK